MSTSWIMTIACAVIALAVVIVRVWPMYRRHRAWCKEFEGASDQLLRGIKEHDDAQFDAGLERMRKLNGIPPGGDE